MISTPERSNGLTTSNRIANPNVPNRRFQFDKRGQLFIGTHNETLSVVAMRVSNDGCSVWILPQLVAPERILNLARVVGRRSRKPSKTVNVPSNVRSLCLVSPDAWVRLTAPEENTAFH
jgi:hypothetical protein